MDEFDMLLKHMAEQEECSVPEGFDNRIRETLDALPAGVKKRGMGAARGALLAAAVCAALVCTAFAASPGLRELLGAFAPYAQQQEDKTYVMEGIEVRVLSAMADQDTIRVYVQLRDLEGHRLTAHMNGMGLVDVPEPPSNDGAITTSTSGAQCLSYDQESGTALMVFTTWGRVCEDLSGANLVLCHLYDTQTLKDITWDTTLRIPLEIELTPATVIGGDTELAAGFFAESMRLSPLGVTAVTYGDVQYGYLVRARLRLHLSDGAEILSCREDGGPDGQGSYGKYGAGDSRRVLTWNFPEPLEVETIESVTIIDRDGGERTFPVELP